MASAYDYVVGELTKMPGMAFRDLTDAEYEEWLLHIVRHIDDLGSQDKAGALAKHKWKYGWGENVADGTYLPKYFGKYPVVRMGGRLVKVWNPNFEYYAFTTLQEYIFKTYLSDVSNAYEFGCGTGHNLLRMHEINPYVNLHGLDWVDASVESINSMDNGKINGHKFDMFKPDYQFNLKMDSTVFTIASLEQLGSNFYEFWKYLCYYKPKYIVHIEPINELLDRDNLLDYLSIRYAEKRNYLRGYLSYLEMQDVDIIECYRSRIGSLFLDGYSVIVWRV